ncbi:MAG: DUF1648 domain-containing protein [Ruminococcaceae bacterium]|nr:DUF1648 domain-containing protein [Oscillospiraceae bacterium]
MKFMKWKILIITCIVCLLPILLGLALWEDLPDQMAIHFNFYGEPDNFASKAFTVFALPCLMVFMQCFCCFINDITMYKQQGVSGKITRVFKWIIPVITLILHPATILYSLGFNIDARKLAVFIVGGMFIVIGNYIPKFDYIKKSNFIQLKKFDIPTDKARKINRFVGYATVIMGILQLASMFFAPVVSVIALLLLIPHTIICVVYAVVVGKSK